MSATTRASRPVPDTVNAPILGKHVTATVLGSFWETDIARGPQLIYRVEHSGSTYRVRAEDCIPQA